MASCRKGRRFRPILPDWRPSSGPDGASLELQYRAVVIAELMLIEVIEHLHARIQPGISGYGVAGDRLHQGELGVEGHGLPLRAVDIDLDRRRSESKVRDRPAGSFLLQL